MASHQHNKSLFLQPPGEIQNRIYRYVVVDGEPVRIGWKTHPWDRTGGRLRPDQPSLMSVDRQLREQIGSIYYAENTFMIDETSVTRFRSTVKAFEIQAGRYAAHLSSITIRSYNFHNSCLVEEAWIDNEIVKSRTNVCSWQYTAQLKPSDQRSMRNLLLERVKDWPGYKEVMGCDFREADFHGRGGFLAVSWPLLGAEGRDTA